MHTNSPFVAQGMSEDCYDTTGINVAMSNDYVEVLGGYSFDNTTRVPSAQHCGVFDGVIDVFPGIACELYRRYTYQSMEYV